MIVLILERVKKSVCRHAAQPHFNFVKNEWVSVCRKSMETIKGTWRQQSAFWNKMQRCRPVILWSTMTCVWVILDRCHRPARSLRSEERRDASHEAPQHAQAEILHLQTEVRESADRAEAENDRQQCSPGVRGLAVCRGSLWTRARSVSSIGFYTYLIIYNYNLWN